MLRFFLERWIQKGIVHQLLLMATLIAGVACAGGVVAWITTPAFEGPGHAVWWAFLRLTDPGYLGDDEGAVLRVISTVITVLGYVMFMGSLIAIMTQWLSATLRKLESGLTPIRMRGHVLVLGWTNRTPEIVLKLLGAQGRLARFLDRRNVRKLRVVILSEEVGVERRLELRAYLGNHWDESQVFLRSGSSLQRDHLQRLDVLRASTIIVPGADFELGGAEASDTRVVKTLLNLDRLLGDDESSARRSLQVVGEIFDPLKASLARSSIDCATEVIASNGVISRLISQAIRHRGLAQILFGILSHREDNSIYLRNAPAFTGLRPRDLVAAFPHAVVLGFVRATDEGLVPDLDPLTEATLGAEDLVVLLSETYDRAAPGATVPAPLEIEHHDAPSNGSAAEVHRILVLGWSHKIASLTHELAAARGGRFELTVMSRVAAAEREHFLERVGSSDERVEVRQVVGDYALEQDLLRVEPRSFDNVVLLASDWMPSSSEADARTVLGYVLLRSLFKELADPPEILIELLDPDNAHLFNETSDVYLVTPRVLSYLLAHVALRPELNTVFDRLFGAGGAEIELWSTGKLNLVGRSLGFREVQQAALEHGVVALGVLSAHRRAELNPDRDRRWTLGEGDSIVVLATDAE